MYYAKALGLYSAAGLDVVLLSPHLDDYHRTPASRYAPFRTNLLHMSRMRGLDNTRLRAKLTLLPWVP